MKWRKLYWLLLFLVAVIPWEIGQANAACPPPPYVPPPILVPGVDYCQPNFANSPVLTKFVDPLPGVMTPLGAAIPGFYNNAGGQNIPVAVAEPSPVAGDNAAYYQIALVEYTAVFHGDLAANPTKLRGYVQIETPGAAATPAGSAHVLLTGVTFNGQQVYGYAAPTYLGPIIAATKGTPTRIKFYNLLPTMANGGNLFIPTDVTVMGAGMGPLTTAGAACDPTLANATCAQYTQNRATLHLHGGDNPWVSDGTAHQWITPPSENTVYVKGVSQQNVPDMTPTPVAGDGTATFFWPNGQSGRLMFYHDHAFGITRLNVYGGEAAGYLLIDSTEATVNAVAPGGEIPLVIQDKSFVNDGVVPAAFTAAYPTAAAPAATSVTDPLWSNTALNPDAAKWGQTRGSLWMPHVWMPNQNPNDLSGANPFGRWDYGQWFWPIFPVTGPLPMTTIIPELFLDTPVINGKAYPYLNVNPTAYRLRILNACNDRYVNLQLYMASSIINGITLATPGSGYTAAPLVTITPAAGDITGKGATAAATVDLNPFLADGVTPNPAYGQVTAITMTTVGSGYTAAPTVTIAPPYAGAPAAAIATAVNPTPYTALTEVGMVPASKTAGIAFPSWWQANDTPGMTPNILDGRQGGVPDPTTIGPDFIHIGSEGGLMATAVDMQNTPIGYEQNKRSVTVLNTYEHTLFLGPAERADVIVDFSQFAGKTLILYNDAPAPLPAGDPRSDYYTGSPDMTPQGGAPPTQAGFGPNTRTMMQIRVGGTANGVATTPAQVQAALNTANTAAGQPALIVPPNTYAKIADTSMTATFNINGVPTTTTIPLQPKTIQELFDDLGRMNATLGVEIPFTTATIQTTIPYGFADPATEVILDGDTQLWKITHNGVDTHAIHFHLFNVQLVNRVGWDGAIKPPWPEEVGWKETVKMNPLEDIIVALKAKTPAVPFASKVPNNTRPLDPTKPPTFSFTGVVDPNGNPVANYLNNSVNFGNEYTWHCHLLGHEENDMMRPVMMAVPPQSPTLNAFVVSKGNLIVSWTDLSPDETAYMVQKRTIANPTWTTIATVPSGTNSYTDTTWKSNQGAQYQVIAVNTVGSGVLNFPSVTAYSLASIPGAAAAPLGNTTITSVTQALALASPVIVKWTYSAKDQTGFTIQRSTSNTFPNNGTTTFTVAGTVFSFNDTTVVNGLKKNTTYYYRVTPTNGFGTGAPSNTASLLVHP